ncbi:MAG: tetratricopeptide repeat protein [Candidatus Omnitrophica bacterium]|jgi:hypothetical protein|nr:tetratricopeptide repeat protein [Candidatus Omnitrophota bacterium]MDD5252358.1 tetratricopeptide repeat protein [Candidatus Omnitrophota bacterium]
MYLKLVKFSLATFIAFSIIFPVFAEEIKTPSPQKIKNNPQAIPVFFSDENAMLAEMDFYIGNNQEAETIFQGLKVKKDHDVALWSNQLGSLYLAEGKTRQAQEVFMDAYLVMNNITAFKDLELKSVGLMGAEATKAYKGDPYEKVFNSFYLGMLLYSDNDFENSLAAFKNGILCDSDVVGNLYKSDVALLYLMASRLELLQNDKSMSDDYFKQGVEAFYLSYPDNRLLVSQEQALLDDLAKKQKTLNEKESPYKDEAVGQGSVLQPQEKNIGVKKVKKITAQEEKNINALKADISKLEADIQVLADKIQENNHRIAITSLKDLVDLNNNTLLCIETGRAPFKYQIGNYGEKAVFTIKPSRATVFNVTVDNFFNIKTESILKNNDVYYQASTRGGRVMDSILKGKADFKKTTADVSDIFSNVSQVYNPYGVLSLFSLAASAVSNATNPYADARHWSLLPAEIQVVPLHLNPGRHQLQIEACDSMGKVIESSKVDVEIKDGLNNVIFKRFLEKAVK